MLNNILNYYNQPQINYTNTHTKHIYNHTNNKYYNYNNKMILTNKIINNPF